MGLEPMTCRWFDELGCDAIGSGGARRQERQALHVSVLDVLERIHTEATQEADTRSRRTGEGPQVTESIGQPMVLRVEFVSMIEAGRSWEGRQWEVMCESVPALACVEVPIPFQAFHPSAFHNFAAPGLPAA